MRFFHPFAAAIGIAAGLAAHANAELVKLQPRPGVELRISIERPRSAAAYALIFAGGHGKIQLDESGEPPLSIRSFLGRAAASAA